MCPIKHTYCFILRSVKEIKQLIQYELNKNYFQYEYSDSKANTFDTWYFEKTSSDGKLSNVAAYNKAKEECKKIDSYTQVIQPHYIKV